MSPKERLKLRCEASGRFKRARKKHATRVSNEDEPDNAQPSTSSASSRLRSAATATSTNVSDETKEITIVIDSQPDPETAPADPEPPVVRSVLFFIFFLSK